MRPSKLPCSHTHGGWAGREEPGRAGTQPPGPPTDPGLRPGPWRGLCAQGQLGDKLRCNICKDVTEDKSLIVCDKGLVTGVSGQLPATAVPHSPSGPQWLWRVSGPWASQSTGTQADIANTLSSLSPLTPQAPMPLEEGEVAPVLEAHTSVSALGVGVVLWTAQHPHPPRDFPIILCLLGQDIKSDGFSIETCKIMVDMLDVSFRAAEHSQGVEPLPVRLRNPHRERQKPQPPAQAAGDAHPLGPSSSDWFPEGPWKTSPDCPISGVNLFFSGRGFFL